jgi:hypothetical protein
MKIHGLAPLLYWFLSNDELPLKSDKNKTSLKAHFSGSRDAN